MQGIEDKVKQSYHFDVIPITPENRFKVMGRVEPFHDQLSLLKGRELEELYKNVDVGGEVVFAVLDEPEPKDVAVVVGKLKSVTLSGEDYRIYIRYLRVVDKNYQQRGIGTALTDEIVERLGPDGFEGRTPNPFVYRADELSHYIGAIHPIHKLHTRTTGALLAVTLPENYLNGLDFVTGRCKGAYPDGEFRLFLLTNASERVNEIYETITGKSGPIQANLEKGDGTVYFEWVKKEYRRLRSRAA